MRQALFPVSVESDVVDGLHDGTLKTIAQTPCVFVALRHFAARQFRGRSKGDEVGYRFGAGASFSFLMTANLLRSYPYAASKKQRSGSFRRIDFVR